MSSGVNAELSSPQRVGRDFNGDSGLRVTRLVHFHLGHSFHPLPTQTRSLWLLIQGKSIVGLMAMGFR